MASANRLFTGNLLHAETGKAKTYDEWQEWFNEKIERDFGSKIFFKDERAEVRDDYEALLRVFGNKTLGN